MIGSMFILGHLLAENTKRQVKSDEVYISKTSLGHGTL